MGIFAAAIDRGPEVKMGPACAVGLWLEGLDDESRDEAKSLMADNVWQHTALAKVFADAGLDVSATTVARHRRGDCKNCG